MDKLYQAQIVYKDIKIAAQVNGKPQFTIRTVYAKDIDQAKVRVENYWKKMYLCKGYIITKLEIMEPIDSKYD